MLSTTTVSTSALRVRRSIATIGICDSAKRLHDFDAWPDFAPMPREEALAQLARWQRNRREDVAP